MTITMGKLLDADLTGSEVALIIKALRLRALDLERQRDGHLKFAAEYVAEDEAQRRKLYQDWANDDTHEIDQLRTLLARLER